LMSATRYAMMMLRFADTIPMDDERDYEESRRTANRVTGY